MYRDEELDDARAYREADWAQEMTDTPGWVALAQWLKEQAQLDRDAIERGVSSWDDYQQRVGRLDAFRKVLDRPTYLVGKAQDMVRGDSQ